MEFTLRIRVHYLFRALLLTALSFYIKHLQDADALHYYLAPNLQKLLLLCPVPLLFIAFGMAWHAITGGSEQICDCEHPLPTGVLKNITGYGLFAIPLLFGLLFPDQALGSNMAAKKGVIYAYPGSDLPHKTVNNNANKNPAPEPNNLNEMFVAKDEYNTEFAELAKRLYLLPDIEVDPSIFLETIGAIDMYKQPFLNKNITLQGFVYREKGMNANMFTVSRFLMMCCPADATPYGVRVQATNAAAFKNDTWVEIHGSVQVATMNGKEALQIKASQIRKIDPPTSPYIFTNPDSVAAFDALHPHMNSKIK